MMESLLKKSYGYTKKKASESVNFHIFDEKRSENCNICRNFANIHDRSHRLTTSHQKNLTERLKIIRSKMKIIKFDAITVHDEQWGKEENFWCYFCDKSVKKHQVYEGCTIVHLGHLTHLTDSQHIESVKSYLKYHGRKDNFELFCKTKKDLEKFYDKIPEAKKKYLSKLNFLHHKDVTHIKEVEAQRQALVSEAVQVSNTIEESKAGLLIKEVSTQQSNTLPPRISFKRNANLNEKPKICPWLLPSEKGSNSQQVPEKPVIGPTIDTLKKHVADQKKKMLPAKRLGATFQRKKVYSSHWLPSFSGVWNKGRHRKMKSNVKNSK